MSHPKRSQNSICDDGSPIQSANVEPLIPSNPRFRILPGSHGSWVSSSLTQSLIFFGIQEHRIFGPATAFILFAASGSGFTMTTSAAPGASYLLFSSLIRPWS